MADNRTPEDAVKIIVLPCSGLDKEAGSASRELALMLSERGRRSCAPFCSSVHRRDMRRRSAVGV